VVPVLSARGSAPRFIGLISDETLFARGTNQVDLFLVADTGQSLQRLRL
jgi:hypothetical protein